MRISTAASRADLYSRVTERVIADLEKGVRPWLKPWSAGNTSSRPRLPRRHNGVPYRGINVLVLWGEAVDKGYGSTIWMTFKQALALGGHVRRGEHGAVIVYADRIIRTETDERGAPWAGVATVAPLSRWRRACTSRRGDSRTDVLHECVSIPDAG
jgi:antirestriction protein ArdC